MDKIWHRGVIKYLQKKELAPKDIHADMVATLGDDAPALSTVQKWAAEFKRGRESLEDDQRSGRPVTATTRENIDRVHHMVMDDSRLTVNQIANAVGISRERVENILHNELGMSKISARWVPRLLTPDQKRTRLVTSQANLALFEANPDDFLERFLTQDECWVHHFEPETMQWNHLSSPPPKKAKVVSLAGKVMVSVFWDAKGIVFIDYLQNGHTINGEYYANLLRQLRKAIESKRPGKLSKGVLFHRDNAPAHKSVLAMAAVRDCGFELIDHPPYSPDLAPSDYFLFRNMKKHLSGKQYRTDDEVLSAVEDFFEGQVESFYTTGIQVLQHRWKKCVDRRGDFVEK
ncbi:histone-lysine N-methyltransferase SETMAR-like [Archocentrus centrarchus]|uniref:histone-lysine N-methyltransferase SETMAR-like n=1 Tax=Archocentrus centrarchus TaxID=63155 RepID=UPI0011EA26F6|nr:histone-lysine N-methyltransferase SETMAR-like [Archocentrus centrarchus]